MDALTGRLGTYITGALILSGVCQPPTRPGFAQTTKNFFVVFCATEIYYNILQKIARATFIFLQNHLHYKKGGHSMDYQNKETIVKSIRFERELAEKIQKMAEQGQRDFTKQVRFMLLEYIRLKEGN